MDSNKPRLVKSIKWLGELTQAYRKWIALSVLSAVTLIGFNILKALLVANLVESALQGDTGALTRVIGYLVPTAILAVLATWGSSYTAKHASILASRDLKTKLVGHITRAKAAHIERYQTGELMTRLNTDTNTVGTFLADHFPNLVFQPLMFICSSAFLLMINWKLFLASYALLPVVFYFANFLNKKGAKYSRGYYEALDKATASIKQCLDGIATIKAYNYGKYMLAKSRESFDKALKPLMRREMCDACSLPFYFLTYESPRILCVVVGAYLTWQGEMTLGGLIASTQLVGYVSAPAIAMMRLLNNTRKVNIAVDRLSEILDTELERNSGEEVVPGTADSCVSFRNVTYGYSADTPVLRHLSLAIPARGLTAVVGGSGEGKSTMLSLLCGFDEPQGGEIFVFDQDITGAHPALLRANLAYVPQDSLLFPGTIADNIRMGNHKASDAQVTDAALKSRVLEFTEKLPEGLNTVLGERGVGLSGGQRQRVAIARATVRKASLMLLDEPTAALDPNSEELINQTLRELAQNTAVVVSSHRLSTVAIADHVLVLENGEVAEQGGYAELMNRQGVLYRLFSPQLNANLENTVVEEAISNA